MVAPMLRLFVGSISKYNIICLVTVISNGSGLPTATMKYFITCEITLQLCCLRESCELVWPTVTFLPVH